MLDSLHRRPRGGPLAALLSQMTGGLVPEAPPPVVEEPSPDLKAPRGELILDALREYRAPAYEQPSPASRELLARLDEADVTAVVERLDEETRQAWEEATPETREYLTLIFGVHHEVAAVLEKTGLRVDVPPGEVHSMGRGPLAAGGDFWMADVIADAAARLRAG